MKKNKIIRIVLISVLAMAGIGLSAKIIWELSQKDETYTFNIWQDVDSMKKYNVKALVYQTEEMKTGSKVPAVIICPGGSYSHYGLINEGRYSARWFNSKNTFAVVLKYRVSMQGYHYPAMMQDVQRTIQYLREHADELNIDENKIGVIGFSAGGHLALWTGEEGSRTNMLEDLGIDTKVSLRPDWICPVYPVVSMEDSIAHKRSRHNLTGKWNPNDDVKELLSLEKHVTENMPPVYLVACTDDRKVKVQNSIEAYAALKEKNDDVTYIQYDKGGHGFGMMNKEFLNRTHWNEDLAIWLKAHDFME